MGDAGREGGEKMTERTGIGGSSIDGMRSFCSGSLSERVASVPSAGGDVSSGELSTSCISFSMSSKARPDCESNGA